MKKSAFEKKITAVALVGVLAAMALTGCGSASKADAKGTDSDKKEITYAKGIGPYTELFEEAIIPILEKKGYTFTVSELDLNQADAAITAGDADVSVEQHSAFMKAYNEQSGGNLVALTRIPTVPASVFSEKHASLEEIGEGQVIAIPQDAGNQARAFVMLEDIGWITLKEGTNFATASVEDVESNPLNLEFYELQTSYIATSLGDFDYGIITGSVVYNAGIDPSTALFNENLSDEFWLQVVVNADNANSQWAKDIVEAYQSEEFLNWIKENNGPKYNELWSIPSYN
ncbi:MAG: metal ABC transporter substrate-binding protein [Butyrivibrio sp.]|nr:metal ABC transporter substrate-binding protein [Butyrivibrio sp.]